MDSEHQKIVIMICSMAGASILGCIFNITSSLWLKLNNTPTKMVFLLSFYDIIANSSFIWSALGHSNKTLCQWQSFLCVLGFMSSGILTCCFAHAFYVLNTSKDPDRLNYYFKIYVVASIVISFAVGICAAFTDFMEPNELGVCSFYASQGRTAINYPRAVILSLPVFAFLSSLCWNFAVCQSVASSSGAKLILFIYPFIPGVCYFPLMIANLTSKDESDYSTPIKIISYMALNAQGLLNAIFFGILSKIIVICCARKTSPQEVPLRTMSIN